MRLRPLFAACAAIALLAGCRNASTSPVRANDPTGPAIAVRGADGVEHVTIDATDNLQFVPNVIDAHIGTIAITLRITGTTPHTLTFDDLHLGTGYVPGRSSKTLIVKVTKTGTYSFDCDYHPYMTGKLVITG